jgi:uncharacterized protein YifN (PemK superfamily)
MAILYAVGQGTALICNYNQFRPPEMVKRRPAIVVSPRLPHRDGLCAVVPLSQSQNARPALWDVRIEFEKELPLPFPGKVFWAKCDMLFTSGFNRLQLFQTGKDQYGRRKYLKPKLTEQQLLEVHKGILSSLGLHTLTWPEDEHI